MCTSPHPQQAFYSPYASPKDFLVEMRKVK
jgi:hypothetical protein